MSVVTLNVSGTRFDLSSNTWNVIKKQLPTSSRQELNGPDPEIKIPEIKNSDTMNNSREIFIEKHSGAFKCILYWFQGGELHLPTDICPSSFKEELKFWGVDESCISKCCFTKYVNFFDDQDVLKILERDQLRKQEEHATLVEMRGKGGWRGTQALMWLVLNQPFYSKASKVYFVLSAIVIVISLVTLVIGTHKDLQRDLTVDEWREYFGDEWAIYKHHFIPVPEAESETEPETESETEPETESETEPESETESEPLPVPENAFERYEWLDYIEYVCVSLFSLDLIVRFIFCPFKISLLFSFLNWVDIFAITVMHTTYIVEAINPREKYEASFLDIVNCLQIVRVFRLFRLVQNFVGFRVLVYAFKASIRDMLLMTLFLVIAMLLFSAFAFFSGDPTFVSIPDACWWAIVTMTTVGYGDVVPKQGLSKIIGVFCALSGVALLAIIIPIFVNNFMLFYAYSKVWGKKYADNNKTETNPKITQVVPLDNDYKKLQNA